VEQGRNTSLTTKRYRKLTELRAATEVDRDSEIGLPTSVKLKSRTYYNEDKARYEGVPDGDEWKVINTCFGVPLPAYHKNKDNIPSILVFLKRYLFENDGKNVVGIFRLAPDKDDCNWAKKQLNDGEFEKCEDVNIIANLIKVWFRDLPVSLLDPIEEKNICMIAEQKPGESGMKLFEELCFTDEKDSINKR